MSLSKPHKDLFPTLSTLTDDKDEFVKTFHDIVRDIPLPFRQDDESDEIANCREWLNIVLKYNVPHGKLLRGRMVEQCYTCLVTNASKENLHLARVLGWSVEILLASLMITDDVMDKGTTRRGQSCWYLATDLGDMAFNDSLLLQHCALQLLRDHFSHLELFSELIYQPLEVIYKAALGQSIETRFTKERSFSNYTLSAYNFIAVHKTAFITVYLPVALAMIFAGISQKSPENKKLWKDVEDISLEIGKLFQIQDDYLDCYAEKETLGKAGNDFQEGKLSWLFAVAKEKCSPEQFQLLVENYGQTEMSKVVKVKNLYDELNMKESFHECQDKLVANINKLLENLDHVGLKTVFTSFLEKIYNRSF